jgi:hypothetical protein
VSSVLDEHAGVQAQDSGLIGLGNISENNINHGYEHSVLLGVSSVFNNGNDVSSLLCHIDEITTRSLGELNCINGALLLFNIKINFHKTKKKEEIIT